MANVNIIQMLGADNKTPCAPLTPEKAIYDENGKFLSAKMAEVASEILSAKDSAQMAETKASAINAQLAEIISEGSPSVAALAATVSANKAEADKEIGDINYRLQKEYEDALYVTDASGNVVAKVNSNGITAISVVDNEGKSLSTNDLTDELKEKIDNTLFSAISDKLYQDKLYVADAAGNVVLSLDGNGLKTIGMTANNIMPNLWSGKVLATYGDSVTALNGGNYEYPYPSAAKDAKWGGKVADFFKFAKLYNRGIGSTCYKYRVSSGTPSRSGGQVAWCKTATGEYVGRDDNYSYDDYQSHVTIPSDCTAIRGDGSSWLRIKTMFPESIKDAIDVVLIMFHNDYQQDIDTDAAWVQNDTTDTEWAASTYYSSYGGDYNISSVKGGVASTIMKLQAWMPNALLVLMTPISGVYVGGYDDVKDLENPSSAKMKKLAECVKDVAFRMSIPCIDVYGNDCINSLNKKSRNYITDGIHPYSDEGCKVIARAIISGLMPIIPRLN